MTIAPKIWEDAERDYVLGAGSLSFLAAKFGLCKSTIEQRCRRGRWVEKRRQRLAALTAALVPPMPQQPPSPIIPASNEPPYSAEWYREKQMAYLKNLGLVELVRAKLLSELSQPDIPAFDLVKLIGSISALVETESRLLGIRDTRRDKPKRVQQRSFTHPVEYGEIAEPGPGPANPDSEFNDSPVPHGHREDTFGSPLS